MTVSSSLPGYADYLERFSASEVSAGLDTHQDGKLNAFEACCARHLRQGRGEALALVHQDTHQQVHTLTYRELDAQSARLAGWLAEQGIQPGDRVACMLPRSVALLVAVMDHYGQTETGMTCNCHHALEHPKHAGGIGVPLPGYRLAILDAEYNELPEGEPGVLAVDTENSPVHFFPGYTWQEKDPFVEGYYLTGDVVIRNEDGTFQFAGRDDDIITTAGYRVGPTDVENSVMTHPGVAESAAVGKPDEIRAEIIKSFVVLREGFEPSEALADEIRTLVRERLSTHAFPREIEFVDELPKTPSGKIQRFKLRAQADGASDNLKKDQ